MRICRTGVAILLSSAFVPAVAQRPAVTSHVTVIARDRKWLVLNSEGKLWRLAVVGGEPELIPTGSVRGINNDHGVSPDGTQVAISAGQIFVLPFAGGAPRQVTEKAPSYFHGWSPDGRTLVYCARRDNNFDVYSISVEGGAEKRLTTHPGYDDGPEYSPDGKWIYFNSDRAGSWDIWRIPAEGADSDDARAQRITSDGTKGHPANQNVVLRMMRLPGAKPAPGKIREVVRLFGGQGTINVSSWSPDSKRFAYVSYSLVK